MPLKLSLKPGETFVVNGAVVRNGDRRGILLLENRARVLREKDIMQPEEASTPAKRAYFAVMQMYLLGRAEGGLYANASDALAEIIMDDQVQLTREAVVEISKALTRGDLYGALTRCRKLIQSEKVAA